MEERKVISRGNESCRNCVYWMEVGEAAAHTTYGTCYRYPKTHTKLAYEWCGEYSTTEEWKAWRDFNRRMHGSEDI